MRGMISRSTGDNQAVIDDWNDDDSAADPDQSGKQARYGSRERAQNHQPNRNHRDDPNSRRGRSLNSNTLYVIES